MKLVVLSDIHSHSRALQHLIDIFNKDRGCRFCVLGDVVGYGPDPVGCLKILKELDDQNTIYRDETKKLALIGGNHEEAWIWCEDQGYGDRLEQICNLSSQERFEAITQLVNDDVFEAFARSHLYTMNRYAIIALLLNMIAMLTNPDPAIEWYRSIIRANGYGPLAFPNTGPGKWNLVLAHGTYDRPLDGELFPCDPSDPGKLERYVNSQKNGGGKRLILLHGHTHVPLYFGTGVTRQPDLIYNDGVINQDADVTVINPGSVGLPRDRDRRPSAALLELGEEGFKTTFLRNGLEDLHHTHIEKLKEGNYPEKIIEFVRTAPTKHNPLAEECEKILQKRAGRHWMINEKYT